MVMWTSWMRGVFREGTMRASSAAAATGPPSRPLRARVLQAQFPGRLESLHHVGGVAAGAEAQGQVPGTAQGPHLLGEDLEKVVVVGHRGENRGVGGQGQGRQRRALHLKAVDELRGQVLGVGGAAAVAEEEDFAAGLKDPGQHLGRGHHRVALGGDETFLEAD